MRLDGESIPFISSRLDPEPEEQPKALAANRLKAIRGNNPRGTGFILTPDEAESLMAINPRNRDCLFPFLTGDDINSEPSQQPTRWIINFFDWPLRRAEQYPDLLQIVHRRVKPQRESLADNVPGHQRLKENWWQHEYRAEELYKATAGLRFAFARSRVSELHMIARVPTGWVYGEATVVFAFDDYYHFALLQSNVHEAWVRRNASTMRTDIRYTPTDCFDTFAFPQQPSPEDRAWAERVGEEYHEHRRRVMLTRNLGLTKTYNLFHSPACQDGDIVRLRELHAEMDRAILACYGWRDIDPGHGFHQNERGQTRFTISPEARRETLRRLLALNLELAGATHPVQRRERIRA